ncbi:ABC transporter permease [Streptomyces sp. NPDC056296]
MEIVPPFALLTLWWFVSSASTSLYFPPLQTIVTALHQDWFSARFASDVLPSLGHLAAGFALATAAGVLVGLVLGRIPFLADTVTPLLEFARATPSVALVPAAVLLLGVGTEVQVVVIASATIWPILLNTIDGVRGLDPMIADVARSYRIRRLDRTVMALRAASPQVVAGMRTALALGIIMIVFSEMVGSTHGIGFQLLQAQRSFDIPGMWAGMVLLGVLGYLLNIAFHGFERAVLGWHRGMRRTHK